MQQRVFVLDKRKQPLMPCSAARARMLLRQGRAVVHRLQPFTIRLKDRVVEDSTLQRVRVKIDPGSKTTGIAVIREDGENSGSVQFLADIHHRQDVKAKMGTRKATRRRRRSENLRHREPRFDNRTRPTGWLPPSVRSKADNILSWVSRLCRWAPASSLSLETTWFDTQLLENPEISGTEYQQGTLAGYEVREYLLEKWSRTCAYCGVTNVPLEIEHIVPRSRGGSDRVSNLAIACRPCNQEKGNLTAAEYARVKGKDFSQILDQAKKPLRDAAYVNATRWYLWRQLSGLLPTEMGTGGRTRYNRMNHGLSKTHYYDAACIGASTPIYLRFNCDAVVKIKAYGRGSRFRTRLDRYGFPRGYLMRQKQVQGFQTGDLVRAVIPRGKKRGTHVGRIAVRATGRFNIQTVAGVIQGIGWRYCRLLQRSDGYLYNAERREAAILPRLKSGVSGGAVL